MEVKAGYKKTEAGVIPQDWALHTVGSHVRFYGGTQPPKTTFKFQDAPGYIRLIQIRDYKTDDFLTFIPTNLAKKTCSARDIMIGRYGPPIFQILEGIAGAYNVALIKAVPERGLVRDFLFYFLKQNKLLAFIEGLSQRTSGQTGIDMVALKGYPLPLPTPEEQTAIATALSDTNALIQSLEKLIAKKRAIKQGAMQVLLTGKRRLPGFKGKWDEKKLGEIGECLRGVSYKPETDLFPHDMHSTVRLLRSNNVQFSSVVFNDIQFVSETRVKPHQILLDEDILICMANGSKQLVGKAARFCNVDISRYTFGAFMGCFRVDSSKADTSFIFYHFQTYSFRTYIDVLLSGSSINNLRPSNIEGVIIPFPDITEQTAIASILSDMDSELSALESKLSKYHTIKQGMMQELLTGKTRLV